MGVLRFQIIVKVMVQKVDIPGIIKSMDELDKSVIVAIRYYKKWCLQDVQLFTVSIAKNSLDNTDFI